ncbi:MAG: LTA synthase family protein, partial [Spirochaetota bacterium]
PVIGGGTANTEFEVLTGMTLYFMSPGIIPYNTYLRRDTPGVASVLKSGGYSTTAIHPNIGTFYNRDKVYRYFGFDTFIDEKGFDKTKDCKGPNVADDVLICKIYQTLEASDGPAFIFAVSMQNHDPYENKYAGFDVNAESDRLSGRQNEIVRSFVQGVYDADRSFGKLIATLEKRGKPAIVYFFGDHSPRLGSLEDFFAVYDLLGTRGDQERERKMGSLKYYMTPYASWSNFRRVRAFSAPVSPSHIAFEILRDAGVPYPSYFNILPLVQKKYPVMHPARADLVDENDEAVKDYRLIQYDLLFGKKYLEKTRAAE